MPLQNKLSVKQIEHTKCPADKESLTLNDGGGLVVVFYRSGRSVISLKDKRFEWKREPVNAWKNNLSKTKRSQKHTRRIT